MGLKVAGLLFAMSGFALAADDHHDHGHEQHDAHVHGEAELLVASEGREIEMMFSSPAINLVGFEHKPGTEAQRKAVLDAVALLKQGNKLFALSGCKLREAEVETGLLEHGDDHDHDHGHAHQEVPAEGGHADFQAHYHFRCGEIAEHAHLEVHLFDHFPGIGKIRAVSVSDHGQHKAELDKDHHHLKL